MKNNIIIAVSICFGLILGFVACNDAEYSKLGIHAFVSESAAGKNMKVTITDLGANAEVTACLSEAATHDVKLKFVIDPTVLDKYNQEQASGYMTLPESAFEMDSEIIIPAGKFSAATTKIHIKPLDLALQGESYAIPLRLVSVDGSVPTTSTTSTYVITTEAITTSSLPMYEGGAGLWADGFDPHKVYPEFTVEVRFQLSNTSNRNRAVFTNGGSILLRFEDPQNDTDQNKKHSMVQFQGQGWYMNPTLAFTPNKWQHLALTYNGKAVTLYVNGAFAGSKEGVAAPEFYQAVWFGAAGEGGSDHGADNSWWNGCKILLSEARIWSVARSAAQVQNNMTTTSAKSEGLEAYWRFNEGEGNTYKDYTGNGHTMTTSTGKMPTWVPGIKSTDESTAWPQ